ncbi:MAG: ribonuclease HII, partial [Bacteroidota bacterium]
MLLPFLNEDEIEAGCDEAGRGCLAGPVFAAAVILPKDFSHPWLTDSKQLTELQRLELRPLIERQALTWSVAKVEADEIDRINILQASFLAMHLAIQQLTIQPSCLLVDGNRFKPFPGIRHHCIVKGDGLFFSIAAASILAKTYRDEHMAGLAKMHPGYGWETNRGYPTEAHRAALMV